MLRELGLDAVCEQVYRALLEQPTLEAGDLAAHLGLTQTRIGRALDELSDLALLRMSRKDLGQRRPVSLDRGITLLLRRQEQELEARRRELADNRAAVSAVVRNTVADRQRMPSGVERLLDIDEIQARMESLVQSAATEACSIIPALMSPEALRAARPLDAELAGRGVAQKSLYHEALRTNAANLAYAVWMTAGGAQVRTAPTLPHRLLIVDRAAAVLPADPGTAGAGAVLITAPGIVAALAELFDHLWEQAAPLAEEQAPDEGTGLMPTERELLRILAAGHTDEAAAKRLGVSVRTVKRRMEDLMHRLDAGSRFQAGLRAGQRGWL